RFPLRRTRPPTLHLVCFFFSSRRRHTRSKRDWSSDVCSSDLVFSLLFLLVQWHPQWLILLTPFLILSTWQAQNRTPWLVMNGIRSEERRVGKERRARWTREQ